MSNYIVNLPLKRAARLEDDGVSLYQIADIGTGQMVGTHLGSIESLAEAEAWVKGGRFPHGATKKFVTLNAP
jgi:hypothetical protein